MDQFGFRIPRDLNSVFFTDINIGYAVGDLGTILKTMDGGVSWVNQNSGTNETFYCINFPPTNTGLTGFVVGSWGTILKTEDGGATWTPQNSGDTYLLSSVYFTDPVNGYIAGGDDLNNSGVILITKTEVSTGSLIIHIFPEICVPFNF